MTVGCLPLKIYFLSQKKQPKQIRTYLKPCDFGVRPASPHQNVLLSCSGRVTLDDLWHS